MVEKLIASFIAKVSEKLLLDLFRAIIKEMVKNRKKASISEAVTEFKVVLSELAVEEITEHEKNAKLIDSGRTIIKRMREP